MDRYDFLDELSRLERASRFPETQKNLFDEGPHLISSPELPWGDEVRHLSVEAYQRFIHGETWITGGGAREMEADIVAFMGNMLGAPNAAGFVTSGGSESNMCAVLAAKQRAGRGGSVVYPANGHYSIPKLCRMFDLEPIVVPAREGSLYAPDPAAIEDAIRPDTIAIIATAGTWAYGSIDPIEEIGAIATARDLYLHVDGAFGGYILPFLESSGYDAAMPPWDFRVDGVCSISADLHKNGMAPPPASTLFFRDEGLLDHAKEICPPNGTISGTRGTGPIAGAWAMVRLLGQAGFEAVSRKSMALRDELIAGVESIDGLAVHEGSRINMALIHASELDFRPVVAALRDRGWMFSARPVPQPIGVVAVTMPHNDGQIEQLLDQLSGLMKLAVPLDPATIDEPMSTYGF
ncbi:aminotransferase class V-fold PLP-dependent enzyme [Actinospongicola halichondriae]|uniref:aminotransferase class V-fold PLP-dependent enzyme n=1 Tax=Actinospongicola halichondriae TaxID=3236844 RepID=UPI003D41FB38